MPTSDRLTRTLPQLRRSRPFPTGEGKGPHPGRVGRGSATAAFLLLAACGGPERQQARSAEAKQETAVPRFPCARGPSELRPFCTAERERTDAGWVVTLRHPDGHFRRILVGDDDRVTAADGAEPAQVTRGTAGVAIAIGSDRYLLPVQR